MVNPSKINWLKGNKASNFVSDINKTTMLFPITSCNISNSFLEEFMMIYSNINLFGFLSLTSCKSLSYVYLSFHSPQLPDKIFRCFERITKNVLWNLPATCHNLLKLLIFLIKLITNLPKPWLFKCNPPQLNQALLMLQLSMMPRYMFINVGRRY